MHNTKLESITNRGKDYNGLQDIDGLAERACK